MRLINQFCIFDQYFSENWLVSKQCNAISRGQNAKELSHSLLLADGWSKKSNTSLAGRKVSWFVPTARGIGKFFIRDKDQATTIKLQ